MNVKMVEKKGCRRILQVLVPVAAVTEALDQVYRAIGERADVPGFRKGKAPRDILEQHFGETARYEAAKRLIPKFWGQAVEGQALDPVSLPEVSGVAFGQDQSLTFTASVDVRPQVKVKSYKGLKVHRKPAVVADEEVNQALRTLQEQQAEMLPVEGRATQEGDWLLCDLEFRAGGEVVDQRPHVWVAAEPGPPRAISGSPTGQIEMERGKSDFPVDRLIGLAPGEERGIEHQFAKEYPNPKLAGRAMLILVKLQAIKSRRLPELDDEFAKRFGDFANLQALKDAIRRDLSRRREQDARRQMEDQLIEQLLSRVELDLPESLVKEETEKLVKASQGELQRRGAVEAEVQKLDAVLRERLEPEAKRRVKAYFILERIAETEAIQPTEEDLQGRLAALARATNQPVEVVRQSVEREGGLAGIRQELRQERVLERLLSQAQIEFDKS